MSEVTRKQRPRYCQFCKDKTEYIDYKDASMLRKYMTDRGKIKPRRVTYVCKQHQNELSMAIKRSRKMALVPYLVPVVSGRTGRGR